MTDEENSDTPAHRLGYSPELETLKNLPAETRRELVKELELIAAEQPEATGVARLVMRELNRGDGEE